MRVLSHHIYEYKKGLRSLVLHSMHSRHRGVAEAMLRNNQIDYITKEDSKDKISIFFGAPECIQVLNEIGDKHLNEFTPEEDFVLGIMLGYDRRKQCERYVKRKQKNTPSLPKLLLCS